MGFLKHFAVWGFIWGVPMGLFSALAVISDEGITALEGGLFVGALWWIFAGILAAITWANP